MNNKVRPNKTVFIFDIQTGCNKEMIFIQSTVKLGFKNRQNKNLLDFKNQITNYQI